MTKTNNMKRSSLLKRIGAAAIASAITVTLATPSLAAPRSKRTVVPAPQTEFYGEPATGAPIVNPAIRPYWMQSPYQCLEDEGYGRYTPCDIGGGS